MRRRDRAIHPAWRCPWRVAALAAAASVLPLSGPARAVAPADAPPPGLKSLIERVGPALVAVKLGLETEDGKRAELTACGLVIAPSGATLMPLPDALLEYPRSYFKRFEIIRSQRVADPLPATLLGLNDLVGVAFVAPATPLRDAPHVDLGRAGPLPPAGSPLVALGLLDGTLGYRCSFAPIVMGPSIGDDEFVVVGVDAASLGLLVVTPAGEPVGLSYADGFDEEDFLAGEGLSSGFIAQPTVRHVTAYVAAVNYVLEHRRDRPEPWLGVAGLNVADREVCKTFGLAAETTAIVVGAVIDGFPAAAAGLKPKDFIIRAAGQPLRRGATDQETLDHWTRTVKRMTVGDSLRLSIWRDGRQRDIELTLAEAPVPPSKADREFTEALGLAVREIVFQDRFERRLDAKQPGVVVANLVQAGPAESAEMIDGDIIYKIDDAPVADLAGYRVALRRKLAASPGEMVFAVLRGISERLIVRVELEPPRAGP